MINFEDVVEWNFPILIKFHKLSILKKVHNSYSSTEISPY